MARLSENLSNADMNNILAKDTDFIKIEKNQAVLFATNGIGVFYYEIFCHPVNSETGEIDKDKRKPFRKFVRNLDDPKADIITAEDLQKNFLVPTENSFTGKEETPKFTVSALVVPLCKTNLDSGKRDILRPEWKIFTMAQVSLLSAISQDRKQGLDWYADRKVLFNVAKVTKKQSNSQEKIEYRANMSRIGGLDDEVIAHHKTVLEFMSRYDEDLLDAQVERLLKNEYPEFDLCKK